MVAELKRVTIKPVPQVSKGHLREWVEGSGVSEALTRLNLRSISDQNAIAKLLNWRNYSGTSGWYVRGISPVTGEARNFGQFKPNEAIQFPDKEKPQKYFSFPKGTDSEVIYTRVDLETWQRVSDRYGVPMPENIVVTEDGEAVGFWSWVLDNLSIPIAITEGLKKSSSLLSQGYVAICLTGVWNGQIGKQKIIPTLEPFTVPERTVNLVFDADVVVKPEVQSALKVLGRLLVKTGCIVYIATWDLTWGKGIDDLLVSQGTETVEAIMSDAQPHSQWLEGLEAQFKKSSKKEGKKKKTPELTSSETATSLAERYRSSLAWNDKEECWYRYEAEAPGIWSEESEIAVGAAILAELKSLVGLTFNAGYLGSVMKLLKHELIRKHWDERDDLIPLIDGVLHKDTLELLPHSPGYGLTWSLPIRWSERAIGCDPIKEWMLEIMHGDKSLVQVLRALLNCVVFGRSNYQRYLEAIGPGGTGKGTLFRLATALVGDKNVFPSTLKNLEENRFELAAAAKAKLIVITEAEKYGGEVNVLKAITGEDKNRIEIKGRQQKCGDGFTFKGFVMLSANEPCQNADYTSGLERRRLSIPFTHQTPPEKRRDLNEEFQPYLAGLLEWVLTMPEAEVRSLVVNTDKTVPSLAKARGEALCDANPLADWMDNCIVLAPGEKTYVGVDNSERTGDWLYANYTLFTRQTNGRPIGTRRYTKLLEDLCCNQLKLPRVKRGRDRNGSYFEGLRIRTGSTDASPRPITGQVLELEPPPPPPPPNNPSPVMGSVMDCDGFVMAETLGSDGCDGCDGFFEVSENLKTNSKPVEAQTQNLGGIPNLEPHSITKVESGVVIDSQPSQPITPIHHNPSHTSQEIDYSTFPHLTSNTIEANRNQANEIKRLLLAATSREELTAIKMEFGSRCRWVWRKLLTAGERAKVEAIAKAEQLNLLDVAATPQVEPQPADQTAEAMPAEPVTPALNIGDTVRFTNPDNLPQSRQFEGVEMRVTRILVGTGMDMAFCQLPDGSEQGFAAHTLELAT